MTDTDPTPLNNDASIPNRSGSGDTTSELTEREAYFQALRLWIQQAQMYQNLSSCFPYYMMSFQGLQNNPTNIPIVNNNYQIQGQVWQFPIANNIPRNPPENRTNETQTPLEVINRNGGYEYVIPPLYKRLLAEFIDFILLFVLKLVVTFMAVDIFEIINIEKFNIYELSQIDDFKLALEFTTEIFILELIYRVLVCFFEASCLANSVGRTGGATPGKALLGLRVVTASDVVLVEGRPKETVLLYPGRPLSFGIALARSVFKNFLISLLFPLCFVLFVFRFNRTGYDLVCGVIVVEENMYPPRRNVP